MPSRNRWTLNPKKWFGTITNVSHRRDRNNPLPRTATTTTTTTLTISSRIPTSKSKIKVIPTSFSNDMYNNTANSSVPITQLQLPAFCVRREKPSILLPPAAFSRGNSFLPAHTEPTIRKNVRLEEELCINTTRWNIHPLSSTTIYDPAKHESAQQNATLKRIEMTVSNTSRRCVIDYPRHSLPTIETCSSPTRSSSSSLNDDNDNSSSSGIFTDERHQTDSKYTLEALSIESIVDSQPSLDHCPTRPMIHHYRRPMSVFDINDDKFQQRQTSTQRSNRSHSAEDVLKDNPIGKSRQSSAGIVNKLERRFPMSQSPTGTLEKAGFVRVTNDTYRLTADKNDYLYNSHECGLDSFVQYSTYDDSLPPAHDEECYASFPRTSSTEQLDKNIQNDLRIMVNGCLRPMITSIGKNRSTKTQHRHKRTHLNHDQTQINVEDITDRLLSSVDCSIYAQYQRCY